MNKIELDRKIYKNIAKASESIYYHKNINFIKKLLKLQAENKLEEVTLVERNYSGTVNKWNEQIIDDYYYNLVKIGDNYIPIPVLVDALFGVNYIRNWDDKKVIKRLYKVYESMKNLFTVKDEEEVEMDRIQEWKEITAIEKVADFIAKLIER